MRSLQVVSKYAASILQTLDIFPRGGMFPRELCCELVKEIGVGLLELDKQVGIEFGQVKSFGFGKEINGDVFGTLEVGFL